MRTMIPLGLVSAFVFSMGCESAAHAHQPTPPSVVPSAAPYRVELVGEHGRHLGTYQHRGRTYILGQKGQRYAVKVTNPTGERVEVVVSIDGLDAVDGKAADVTKRGYVLPAYGDVTIEGFRTSTENVAAFRFASVADSYAGRKGEARNVGVIGVAFFPERPQPQAFAPDPEPYDEYEHHHHRHGGRDLDDGTRRRADASGKASPPRTSNRSPSATPAGPPEEARARGGDSMDSTGGGSGPGDGSSGGGGLRKSAKRAPSRDTSRPGLGTEFGESRHSRVSYTSFQRANASRPGTVAELRYDNARGLAALGINVYPRHQHHDETYLRETANPFPGSFATPPPGGR